MAGEASVVSTFNPSWTTVPEDCNITYRITIKSLSVPADPNVIVIEDATYDQSNILITYAKVTVGANTLFY